VRGIVLRLTRARYGLEDWPKEFSKAKELIRKQFGEDPAPQLRPCRWSTAGIRRELEYSLSKSTLSAQWTAASAEDGEELRP
jgi:hypothetical protein